MIWLGGFTDAMDRNLGKLQEMVREREAWSAASLLRPLVLLSKSRLSKSTWLSSKEKT